MFNRSYNHKDVLTRASMTIQLIDDIVLYKAQLFSTNGNILSSSERDTTISVVVFKGVEDITQRFTDIVWSRFSANNGLYQEDLKWGEQHKGKTTITVTRNDINEKANIQVAIYDTVNGERRLVASDFISLIDVNDIKGSNTPPENPKDGDLWLNTNSFPPKLMVWNAQLGEWVELIVAGAEKRNLLRNSNFYASNFKHWTNIGSPTTTILKMSGKKWARIRSDTAVNNYCGISQTIDAKSSTKYVFQMLSKIYAHSANPNCKAVAAFYSIDSNNQKTLILEKNIDITLDAATHTTTFTSLTNTKKIEVVVSGQKQAVFDFVVTNLKLEANSIPTAWEIAIEDMEDALNQKLNNSPEEVFESLTDGGKMQGLYVDTDENGKKNYYFNASYIKSGYISGQYINAKNLTVTKNDGSETFKIDSNGNVTIKGNIQIQGFDGSFKDAASVEDITYTVVLTNENHSIMCNANGTPISGQIGSSGKAKTKVLAYKGNRLLQAVDTTSQLADGKFCVNIKSTDGTGTLRRVPGSYDEYYIDGTISDNGYFDLEIIFEKTSNAKAIKRFTYAKIKPGATGPQGVPGPQGLQGLPGTSGTDGKTTYFHIKYSAVSNPTSSSQMTDTPNTYIGTYVDYTATSSTDPKKYTWARFQGIQGSKGEQGIPGTNGANGKTTYLHIKYSNDGGKTFTGNNGEDVGSWIGQYTDFNINDSTSVSAYKWSKIQGATGPQGPQGSQGAQGPMGPQGPQGEALDIYDGTFSEGTKFWSLSYANYTKPNTNTQTKTANTSIYGGKTLKITNDTWLYSKNPIPIEEGRVYKFIFRVRQLQNPTNDNNKKYVYAGATEFAHDGTKLSVNNGTYFVASSEYLSVKWNSVNGDSAPATYNSAKDDQYVWTEYTKYMSTTSKTAITYANVVKFPAVNAFNARTKYIKPMFIVNYSGGNGIAEVDSLIVKDVTSEYEAAKESANKLNNNAQEVWDKITQEGKTQGLFVAQNGKVYINGEYINAKNLRVQDKDNNLTLGVDDNGNVTIRATSLSIGSKTVASKDDISTSIGDIQIGGRNWMRYSSPELLNGLNASDKWSTGRCVIKSDYLTSSNDFNGKKAYWITITDATDGWAQLKNSADRLVIEPNMDYVVSFQSHLGINCKGMRLVLFNSGDSKSHEIYRKTKGVTSAGIKNHDKIVFRNPLNEKMYLCIYNLGKADTSSANPSNLLINNIKIEKGNKATDWTPAPEDIDNTIESVKQVAQSNSSSINVMQGQITTAINNTQIVKDGQAVLLKDEYNKTVAKVDSINATIGSHTSKINELTGNITSVDTKVNSVQRDLEGTKSTVSSHSSSITDLSSKVSTQGSSISQLKDKIALKVEQNDINTSINNLQIGGRNLISTSYIANRGCSTFSYDKAANTWTCIAPKGSDSWGYGFVISSNQKIPVEKGKTFIVSLEVNPSIDCIWNNDVNNSYNGSTSGNDHDDTSKRANSTRSLKANTWTKCWFSYTAKSSVSYDLFEHNSNWGIVTTSLSNDVSFKFRNVKGEYGNKPTDWTPAPQDVDSAITSVDNKVTTTSNKVATIETDLTKITQRVSSTETKVTTITNTANNALNAANGASSKIDNLEIGGRNLILNSALNDHTNWIGGIIDTSKKYENCNSLKFTGISNAYSSATSAKVGDVFTISIKSFIATSGGNLPLIILEEYKDNTTNRIHYQETAVSSTLNSWQNYTKTWTVKNSETTNVRVRVYNRTASYNFWASQPKLERGAKATDWTPAPEDVQTQLDTNKTEISSTKSKVASIETDLTGITQRVSSTETKVTTITNTANTANSNATSALNAANSANNKINGLEIGGRNLFLKSDIDKYSKGNWLNYGSGSASVEGTYIDGTKTIKIVGTEGISYNSYIKLKRNTVYTYSMMMKSSGAISMSDSSPLHMWLNTTTTTAHLETIVNKGDSIPANTWTKAWISFKTPNAQDTYYMKPFVYGIGSNTVYIAKVKLEEGTKATDWTPASEDIQVQIDANKNEITSTNSKVSSIETDLTGITSRVTNVEKTQTAANGQVTSLESRMTTAESKITDKAIINTVSSTIDSKVTAGISNIQIGGRNLAQKTSNDFSTEYTNFSGVTNTCPNLGKVLTDGLKVGDKVTVKLIYEYSNIVAETGQKAQCWIQGSGNVTAWESGSFSGCSKLTLNSNGTHEFLYNFTVNANHLKNEYWDTNIRHDYVKSGSVKWKMFKVEKGTNATDWTPAPEDIANQITDTETMLNGNIDNAVSGAKTDILNNVANNYANNEKVTQLQKEMSSKFEQTSTDMTMQFSTAQNYTKEVDGKLQNFQNTVATHIRFSENGIDLGKTNSAFSTTLDNTKLAFKQNGEEIAYVSNNKMYITQAEIKETLRIGNSENGFFSWVQGTEGNLSLKWSDQ